MVTTARPATVEAYLAALPDDRRAALTAIREVILKNLDQDYEEGMQYGMIGYYVPHRVFPAGYHCDPRQPLPFAGLASQKSHMSLALMGCYGSPEQDRWLRSAWTATGRKLDMGKACIRFKKLEDVPLDVVGEAFRRMPAREYIAQYEANLARSRSAKTARRAAAGVRPARAPATKPASRTASRSASKAPAKKPIAKKPAKKKANGRSARPAARKTAGRRA